MRRIPLEDFFRKPARIAARLSPDGTHAGFLAPWERRLNLHVRELATGREWRVTSATARDLASWFWASDRRLAFVQDSGGDENWHLFAIPREGGEARDLTPFEGAQALLVDDLPDEDDVVLVGLNRRDPRVHDVFRANVATGALELVAKNPGNVSSWLADHAGRVRVATTTDGVSTSILARDDEGSPWRTVATHGFRESAIPLLFTGDDRALYVASNVGRDRRAVLEYDLAAGRETRLLLEHPDVDVGDLRESRLRRVPTLALVDTDRPSYVFLDAERERIQRAIDARLPGRFNGITSWSRDERRALVFSWNDRTLGSTWLLDVPTGELVHLFDHSPWLKEEELAAMEPIRLEARDGLALHGYLTRPPGASGPTPLVVHPHGGPWVRDTWRFNPEVQFLANRGYAVLQVNYRGSTGYGRKHWEAGFGQWGLAMQEDLEDAVHWAVGRGLADPARVAIYGGSYGGYATLSGITKTPDLYRCAVSYVGVANIFTWIAAFPPYWEPFLEMVHEMVGHPQRDEERLRATSPVFQADRIRVPLFVAQGANDPRVRKAESDQMVAALRSRGVEVEYMVKDDEGHGFGNEENQFDFYRAMEAFLERHLAP